jgi:hypothetical protein
MLSLNYEEKKETGIAEACAINNEDVGAVAPHRF